MSSFVADVRLVVGAGGTGRLLAGIWPLGGAVLKRGYRLRLELNTPASVIARLYRAPRTSPVAATRATRGSGESTLTLASRRALAAGVYAVDLQASAGPQRTRAVAWVYIGGRLTEGFVRLLQARSEPAALGFGIAARRAHIAEPMDPPVITGCHRFSPARIDCAWYFVEVGDWTSASVLTAEGQVYTRKYQPGRRAILHAFDRHPRWEAGQRGENLDQTWGDPVATPRASSRSG